MNLEQKIEAVLFYKNEPVKIKELAKIFEESDGKIKEALENLAESLRNRGLCLIKNENEAVLATAPEMKEFLENIAKEEMRKEIGKAGLETLAIVLYNGGATRREIDYIRGVNSAFILRNLSIRGLVEKTPDPKDQRIFKYKATLDLLAHIGLKSAGELPGFADFKEKINSIQNKEDGQN